MKDDIQLAKWLNGEMNGKELNDFTAAAEYDTYSKIKEYSAQLTAPQFDMDALYDDVAANRERQHKVRTLISPWLSRVAAVLVLALGITYYLYTTNTTTQLAAAGQHTEFLLPDHSAVVLNAGSSAEFRSWNWKNNRNVALDGEAYFKVAKGEKFDVTTSLGKVTVVGTQFNVKARNNRLDVTCFEGKVKVTNGKSTVILTPGKSISFEAGAGLPIPNTAATQPGWMANEITFVNEKPENVIAEMERQFNVTIKTKTTLTKRYNATLPTKDLNKALQIFTDTYQLKVTKTKNKIILSSE